MYTKQAVDRAGMVAEQDDERGTDETYGWKACGTVMHAVKG